ALVRQLGFDLHEAARRLAATPPHELYTRPAPARLAGQTPPAPMHGPRETIDAHLSHLFHDIWNRRRFDLMTSAYAPDVRVHTAGGRVAQGVPALRALHLSLLASMPDSSLQIGHVSWSDETDGIIGAVRWELAGTARSGGWLGSVPDGVPIAVPGMTHCRFDKDGRIVEEWTVWDEVGVLAQAYREAA
ncbi:MAG: ester cyclase, partial [Caulobacteraceae bacterium]|nr:ester cyclase [Caulobacteraceae bacterium]